MLGGSGPHFSPKHACSVRTSSTIWYAAVKITTGLVESNGSNGLTTRNGLNAQGSNDRRGGQNAPPAIFYHATRMHSAHYAVARCLSVSHTPVLSLNGYTYPQSFFTTG